MKNHQDQIVQQFNQAAHAYDHQRRRLIPCYEGFYSTAVALADSTEASPRILDLGAGTGLLSSLLLKRYPNAKLTLMDLSESMLDVAKERFSNHSNVQYIVGDYTDYVNHQQFDMIVSALSIHHLSHEDKKVVYQNSFNNLREGGIFINADQVQGCTSYLESLYVADWKRKVEASDLPKDVIHAAYERTALDRMSTLPSQLAMLEESGFSEVDCVYKSYNFVVLYGRKG